MITFGVKIHARICRPLNLPAPHPHNSSKALSFKGLGCLTIPACTSPSINWIRCRDVRFSHLLLRKTKDHWGAVDTSVSGHSISRASPQRASIHFLAALGETACFLRTSVILFCLLRIYVWHNAGTEQTNRILWISRA